jgi:hypothetical protein
MLRDEVVRGGVEPPTFRFSGGFAGPRESMTGRLSGLYAALAACGVQVHRHVSTAVVSAALARSAVSTVRWSVSVAVVSSICLKLDSSTV